MKLLDPTMYVYAYGDEPYLGEVARTCEDLGLIPDPGGNFWERDEPSGTVEAIRVSSGSSRAMLVCRSGPSWRALRAEWPDLPAAGRIGEVHILYAVHQGPPNDQAAVATAAGVDVGPLPADATSPWPGVRLWQIAASPVRVLVLVGPEPDGPALESQLWPAGRTQPAVLPAMLWQAARLRHEEHAFADRRPPMRERQVALHRRVAALLEAGPGEQTTPIPEAEMLQLQWDTAHVAADEALLRTQAVTVNAIQTEYDDAVRLTSAENSPAGPTTSDGGPLADDANLGRWLAQEIADLAESARAAVAFAEPVARAAQTSDERLLRALTERTQYYVTVQAAALGALLVVLATVQSIAYDWPTAEYLKLPVTAVLGLLALVLPIWAAWRPTAAAPDRRTPRWLAAPALAAAAAIAWLAATATSHTLTGHPAPTWLSAAAAAIAVLVGPIALTWRPGRTGPPRSPRQAHIRSTRR